MSKKKELTQVDIEKAKTKEECLKYQKESHNKKVNFEIERLERKIKFLKSTRK